MTDPIDPTPPSHSADFASGLLPRDMLTPALRSDPESFPVLKAFQEYIEAERERARKRLVTVSAVAIGAIVLIVGAFLGVGSVMVGSLMRRNDQLQDAVIRAAVREGAVPMGATSEGDRGDSFRRMDESLRKMQEENAALQRRMVALQELPTTFATTMEQTLSNWVARPSATGPAPSARGLPPPPSPSPFAPPGVPSTVSSPAPATPRPAARPDPAPRPSAGPGETVSGVAAKAVPAASEPSVVTVPPRVQIAPRIDGYAPARLTLVTDRGVAIPWRVVIPE